MAKTVAEIAALIHADMCDDDRNGYSWSPRQGGDYGGNKTLTIDGKKYTYPLGSYDCSSSVIKAWQLAIQYTKYKGRLDGATYTGNMRSVFKASGLFDVWDTDTTEAVRGDVYLNDANHTAMCQDGGKDGVYGYDALSEFCINENGEVYGGKVGDQTGTEAYIHAFYNYPWNVTLHYNGKADGTTASTSAASSTSTSAASSSTAKKKTLNGIDIASYQEGIDVSKVSADFIIVKVSGGTSYVNDKAHGAWRDWRDIANAVLKAGKLLGLYHYACEYGSEPGGKAEAEFFLKQIKGFEGKAVLCLDWEEHAQSMPVSYAKAWLDTVAKATGATPMFYGYASYLNSRDHSSIKKYPLWMASYLYRYEYGKGYVDNPANTWDTGSWDKMTMYQYSSTRYISGYSDRLDVNIFYGTADDWKKLCGSGAASSSTTPASSSTSTDTAPKTTAGAFRISTDSAGKKWLAAGKQPARGKIIRWIAAKGFGKYRVFTEKNGWLPYVNAYDVNDLENGCAGDGSPILAVEFKSSNARYAVRVLNRDWYPDMIGRKDTAGSSDHFAGDLANRIDGFRISKA